MELLLIIKPSQLGRYYETQCDRFLVYYSVDKGEYSRLGWDEPKEFKAVAFAFFCKSDDKHLERLRLQLYGKEMLWFSLMEGRIYGQDVSYDSIDKVVKNLKGIIKAIEKNLKYRGYISLTDYKNRCGNCQAELLPEENYCKQCGTKRGEGAFKPYKNEMCGLYGPPTTSVFRCQSCKDTFSDWTIGTSRVKFCPKCGSRVKRIKEVLE